MGPEHTTHSHSHSSRRSYIIEAVDSPLSWEDLRSSKHLKALQPLINYLSKDCHHTAVVAALIALKGHFKAIESDDNCDINEARGLACELVAWQFVLTLSDQEALEYLLFELREDDDDDDDEQDDEETGLLSGLRNGHASSARTANGNQNGNGTARDRDDNKPNKGEGFSEPFMNLVSNITGSILTPRNTPLHTNRGNTLPWSGKYTDVSVSRTLWRSQPCREPRSS